MSNPLEQLVAQRSDILDQIQALGDLRRGSISERYRQCGKHPCVCESKDHPGHGPYYSLTYKIQGKTVTRQLRAGPMLQKAQREIEAFRQLRILVSKLVQVNEQICEAREVGVSPAEGAQRSRKKKSRRSSRRKSPRR